MKLVRPGALLGAGLVAIALAEAANAGGLERDGYNIDLLYEPGFAAEATATYVLPERKLNNVVDTNPANGIGYDGMGGGAANGVKTTPGYWIPRIGFKAGIGESIDCLANYSEPWGVHSDPGLNWMGANDNIETKVNSHSYAATCSYRFQAGPGQLRFIGGLFYQQLDGFQERLVAPVPFLTGSNLFGNGIGRLNMSADGTGWRIGTAYEIPEIALRASLVYNSEVKLNEISGTLDLRQIPGFINPANPLLGKSTDVTGSAAMPQSLELRVQSGIAPDWLAFGSVKWVQWSKLQSVLFCSEATLATGPCTPSHRDTSLDLLYRDGWTVIGGVGHKFNDQWAGAVSLTWDRGTSTGLGYQTDSWTVATAAAYTPLPNVELRLAGALGIMTSGSSGKVVRDGIEYGREISYDFGNDTVAAFQAALKVKW